MHELLAGRGKFDTLFWTLVRVEIVHEAVAIRTTRGVLFFVVLHIGHVFLASWAFHKVFGRIRDSVSKLVNFFVQSGAPVHAVFTRLIVLLFAVRVFRALARSTVDSEQIEHRNQLPLGSHDSVNVRGLVDARHTVRVKHRAVWKFLAGAQGAHGFAR